MSTYGVYSRAEAQRAMDDLSLPAQTVVQELWLSQHYQTVEELTSYADLSEGTVEDAIDELEEHGLVRSGSNAANPGERIYYLNVEEVLYAED